MRRQRTMACHVLLGSAPWHGPEDPGCPATAPKLLLCPDPQHFFCHVHQTCIPSGRRWPIIKTAHVYLL